MSTAPLRPVTVTGSALLPPVAANPFPSWPRSFAPQHSTAPLVRMAHTKFPPAASLRAIPGGRDWHPAGHALGSAQPILPLQFVSIVLVHVSGAGRISPVQGPNWLTSPPPQVCVPSEQVPTWRVAGGPV